MSNICHDCLYFFENFKLWWIFEEKVKKFISNIEYIKKISNFYIDVYNSLECHGIKIKMWLPIIIKLRDYGHRPKVKSAIKYSILLILQNFKLK